MFKYYVCMLPKNKKKKLYECRVFKIGHLKAEMISQGRKKMYRLEWSDWED